MITMLTRQLLVHTLAGDVEQRGVAGRRVTLQSTEHVFNLHTKNSQALIF